MIEKEVFRYRLCYGHLFDAEILEILLESYSVR